MGLPFINADLIARAMAPDAPSAVGYLAASAADHERRILLKEGVSFCKETVLSDPAGEKIAFLREAQGAGYTVILVFIGLDAPALCVGRILQRVGEGGHDVLDEKILARYPRTLENLRHALPFVDWAFLFDNSSCDEPYRFVASFRRGRIVKRGSILPSWTAGVARLERKRKAAGPPRSSRGAGRERGGGAVAR